MFDRCRSACSALVAPLLVLAALTAGAAEASDDSERFRSASEANAQRAADGRKANRHRRISSQPRARKRDRLPSAPAAPPDPPTPPNPPEPPAPPGASIVPGTGAVVAEDLATEANPCLIWGRISDPQLDGCDPSGAQDPFIVRRSGDGDPHLAVGQRRPSPYYRRYISRAGVQSVYDRTVSRNRSTRTQTQKWSATNNPMAFAPGDYAFYYSFRLQELASGASPFPHEQAHGGGNAKYSQLLQFKSHGGGLDTHLPFSATIGSDGIKFIARDGEETLTQILEVPTGEWIRIAIVSNWDSDGWYEVWADLDQDGSMTRVLERQYGIDFMAGRPRSSAGIGLYHHIDLFDGSVAGQPRQETVYTDYANVQITEWSAP